MVWNSARVSCLQRDWQFRFEGVIVLFHTLNEQFVFLQGDKLRQFSATGLQDFSLSYHRACVAEEEVFLNRFDCKEEDCIR